MPGGIESRLLTAFFVATTCVLAALGTDESTGSGKAATPLPLAQGQNQENPCPTQEFPSAEAACHISVTTTSISDTGYPQAQHAAQNNISDAPETAATEATAKLLQVPGNGSITQPKPGGSSEAMPPGGSSSHAPSPSNDTSSCAAPDSSALTIHHAEAAVQTNAAPPAAASPPPLASHGKQHVVPVDLVDKSTVASAAPSREMPASGAGLVLERPKPARMPAVIPTPDDFEFVVPAAATEAPVIPSHAFGSAAAFSGGDDPSLRLNQFEQFEQLEQLDSIEEEGRLINLAAAWDGAALVAANKEAKKPENAIDADSDSFMKNHCSANKWIIVELSQLGRVDEVELTMKEMYSSRVRDFVIKGRQSHPKKDGVSDYQRNFDSDSWQLLGNFTAANRKGSQSFKMSHRLRVRYLLVQFLTHYGNEEVCALNTLRVLGISAAQELEAALARQLEHRPDPNPGVAVLHQAAVDLNTLTDSQSAIALGVDANNNRPGGSKDEHVPQQGVAAESESDTLHATGTMEVPVSRESSAGHDYDDYSDSLLAVDVHTSQGTSMRETFPAFSGTGVTNAAQHSTCDCLTPQDTSCNTSQCPNDPATHSKDVSVETALLDGFDANAINSVTYSSSGSSSSSSSSHQPSLTSVTALNGSPSSSMAKDFSSQMAQVASAAEMAAAAAMDALGQALAAEGLLNSTPGEHRGVGATMAAAAATDSATANQPAAAPASSPSSLAGSSHSQPFAGRSARPSAVESAHYLDSLMAAMEAGPAAKPKAAGNLFDLFKQEFIMFKLNQAKMWKYINSLVDVLNKNAADRHKENQRLQVLVSELQARLAALPAAYDSMLQAALTNQAASYQEQVTELSESLNDLRQEVHNGRLRECSLLLYCSAMVGCVVSVLLKDSNKVAFRRLVMLLSILNGVVGIALNYVQVQQTGIMASRAVAVLVMRAVQHFVA